MGQFTKKQKPNFLDSVIPEKPTHAHEYEQVHEHEYAPKKEIRSKRLNLIIKPSMSDRLDRYAKTKGISKNNLIENMIEELLSGEGF